MSEEATWSPIPDGAQWEPLPDSVVRWRDGDGLEGQLRQLASWIERAKPEWIYLLNLRTRTVAAQSVRRLAEALSRGERMSDLTAQVSVVEDAEIAADLRTALNEESQGGGGDRPTGRDYDEPIKRGDYGSVKTARSARPEREDAGRGEGVVVSCTNPDCDHWRTATGELGEGVANAIQYGEGIVCDFCGEQMEIERRPTPASNADPDEGHEIDAMAFVQAVCSAHAILASEHYSDSERIEKARQVLRDPRLHVGDAPEPAALIFEAFYPDGEWHVCGIRRNNSGAYRDAENFASGDPDRRVRKLFAGEEVDVEGRS